MSQNIYLMRHAESMHNATKKQWKNTKSACKVKETLNYNILKYNPKLLDPQVIAPFQTMEGPQQLETIQLIITSPLKRCLSTARQALKRNPRAAVLVEPLLSCRLSSAWSVGTQTSKLKMLYPQFDFSFLEHSGELWQRPFLDFKEFNFLQQLGLKYLSNSEDFLKVLAMGKEQKHVDFVRRVTAFREVVWRQIKTNSKYGYRPNILIIAHNNVLNVLLGRTFQNGKLQSKYDFKHAQPVVIQTPFLGDLQAKL